MLWLRGAKSFAETDETTYRLVPVLFGLGLIVLLPLVADGLGRGAVVAAGILTAISPAMVFYSRYYVQEMLLVFFTFAAIASAWRYVCTRRMGWAISAGAALGFMHATKETWVLTAAAMAAAVVLSIAWTRWRDGTKVKLGELPRTAAILAAAGVACLVAAAFYSSFGENWRGPWDSIRAYVNYCQRGSEGGIHSHPWYYYFELLLAYRPARGFFWTEGLIAVLALVGAIVSLALRQRGETERLLPTVALGRFLTFYTVVLMLLYAVIPYKTPWCLLSFLHGMILLAGIGAWVMLRWMPGRLAKGIAFAVLAIAAVHLGRQAYALNFRFPADQRNPYVYAHATGDVLKLAAQMQRLAQVYPGGYDMSIHVVTPENFWPLRGICDSSTRTTSAIGRIGCLACRDRAEPAARGDPLDLRRRGGSERRAASRVQQADDLRSEAGRAIIGLRSQRTFGRRFSSSLRSCITDLQGGRRRPSATLQFTSLFSILRATSPCGTRFERTDWPRADS